MEVIRLHALFELMPRTTVFEEGTLIVCECEGHAFALFVDEVIGRQEIVSKSLGTSFQHVRGLAGCAILGNGRIGLILDVNTIYQDRGRAGAIAADRRDKETTQ